MSSRTFRAIESRHFGPPPALSKPDAWVWLSAIALATLLFTLFFAL